MDEALAGDWQGLAVTYAGLAARIPRQGGAGELAPVTVDLEALAREIGNQLETLLNSDNISANEFRTERHIQNSNPELLN